MLNDYRIRTLADYVKSFDLYKQIWDANEKDKNDLKKAEEELDKLQGNDYAVASSQVETLKGKIELNKQDLQTILKNEKLYEDSLANTNVKDLQKLSDYEVKIVLNTLQNKKAEIEKKMNANADQPWKNFNLDSHTTEAELSSSGRLSLMTELSKINNLIDECYKKLGISQDELSKINNLIDEYNKKLGISQDDTAIVNLEFPRSHVGSLNSDMGTPDAPAFNPVNSRKSVETLTKDYDKLVKEIWNIVRNIKDSDDKSIKNIEVRRNQMDTIEKQINHMTGNKASEILADSKAFLENINKYIDLLDQKTSIASLSKDNPKIKEIDKELDDLKRLLDGESLNREHSQQSENIKNYSVLEYDGVTYVISNDISKDDIIKGLDGIPTDKPIKLISNLVPGLNKISVKKGDDKIDLPFRVKLSDDGKITVLSRENIPVKDYQKNSPKVNLGNYATYKYDGVTYVFGNDLDKDKILKGIPGLEGEEKVMLVNSLKPGDNQINVMKDGKQVKLPILVNLGSDGLLKVKDDKEKELKANYFGNTVKNSNPSLNPVSTPTPDLDNSNNRNEIKEEHPMKEKLKRIVKNNWQRVVMGLVGLGVLASGALGIVSVINNMPENAVQQTNTITTEKHQISDEVKDKVQESQDEVANVNYQSVVNDVANSGLDVYSDAYSATSRTNGQDANEWFQYGSPIAVYNTASHSYQDLTPEMLDSLDALKALANDPNNAVLFGESMQNASGFMNAQDLVANMQK